MTLTRFVTKNAFRNKRRSILTVLSITFSLLLLTFMMAIWRGFYMEQGSEQSAQRLVVRNKVSLVFSIPVFYREKIRSIPGVVNVVNAQWFGGKYKDDKSQNFFAQFGTDPTEFNKVFPDFKMPQDQIEAWQKDRAGAIVDSELAKKYKWKIGDKIIIQGQTFPVDLDLTIRGIFTAPQPTQSLYFNKTYLDEAYPVMKGNEGVFYAMVDTPQNMSRVASTIDDMFRNSTKPTKTETEKAFSLGFIAMLGNVKAFILSICGAVVFAILLVSANTIAMSIRERTREVAVLKTLGFTRNSILGLFVGEAVSLALIGGLLGAMGAFLLGNGLASQGGFFGAMKVTGPTVLVALVVAGLMGFFSAVVPSYHASQVNIVDGLRHIG